MLQYRNMEVAMTNVPLSLRVKPAIRERLESKAKDENRSLSQMASIVLENFFNEEDERETALKMALIEAERELGKGEFISQEAMHNWINSLGTEKELPMPEPDIFLNKK